MISEKDFEDIVCKYPELIEDDLLFKGRQITLYGRRMDVLFEDKFKRKLIIELKAGPIKDEHIGQILAYEGMLLSTDDPTIKVMLVGTRVPPNIQRSLDHHGIAWKEISMARLREYIHSKGDQEFLGLFSIETLPMGVERIYGETKNVAQKSKDINIKTANVDELVMRLKSSAAYIDFKAVVGKKAENEEKARVLIKNNIGKLDYGSIKQLITLVDEAYMANAYPGKYKGGAWFGRLLAPNARGLLQEDIAKVNQWFELVTNENISIEERLRLLLQDLYCISGLNVGFITLIFYLLNKKNYCIWFNTLHEGLRLVCPQIQKFNGSPKQYNIFNNTAKEFIKKYDFDHTELDWVLSDYVISK